MIRLFGTIKFYGTTVPACFPVSIAVMVGHMCYGCMVWIMSYLTKPKSMTVEENKMILNSMVYAARELERFHMLHMSDGYSLRWYAKQFSVYGKPFKDGLGRDCEVFVIESRKPGGLVKAKKIVLDRQ